MTDEFTFSFFVGADEKYEMLHCHRVCKHKLVSLCLCISVRVLICVCVCAYLPSD